MLGEIATILANPLNQILLSVPLSVVGNFSSDAVKALVTSFNTQGGFKSLEGTLFVSFLQAIEIHQKRYDIVAKNESAKLKNIAVRKKSTFLVALKSFDSQDEYHLPEKLDDASTRELLARKIIEVFKEDIPEEKIELVEAITRDTLSFYREAFFKKVSQENQLWIIFRESLKITSLVEIIKEIQKNLPTRDEFEAIRAYIVKNDVPPEEIQRIKQNYLDYLERKFSSIELTGVSPRVRGQDISFKLEDIFIPFNIESNQISGNIFVKNRNDSDEYISLFEKNEPLSNDKINLLKNLARYPQIVLLGDPGGGKTTLLKYITYQLSRFQRQDKFLPFYLPIFLRISEYAQILKTNPSKHLLDFLLNDYDKQFSTLYNWAFENGQVVLLLDGLDEVLDVSQRFKVVEEIQDIVARMPENRYIVTSRFIGYDRARLGSVFKHFTIEKFNRQQIRLFCRSWYKAVAKNSLQDINSSELEADKLYNAIIGKKTIEDLACNPLMVTLIANMHFKGQSLPHNRVKLYEIATETLLQYWVQRRITDAGQLKEQSDIIDILSPVSFYIHKNNPEGLIAENDFYEQCRIVLEREDYNLSPKEIKKEIKELVRFLREQSGFFHEKGTDESTGKSFFGFLHQTFQEYFTAIEIVNQWKDGTIKFYDILQNSRWTESLRLAAGELNNAEKGRSRKRSTTQFVEDILKAAPPEDNTYIRSVLLVVLIIIDEIDLIPQAQDNLFDTLFTVWSDNFEINMNKEIEKHLALLISSKHQDYVWKKIQSFLEKDQHILHTKIPRFIIEECLAIQEAKKCFLDLLISNNSQILNCAWASLKQYIYDIDMGAYYETQQYGYLSYFPGQIADLLLSYSDFLAKIELIPENLFSSITEILANTLDSYLWIYFADNYYSGYSKEVLLSEIKSNTTERARVLFMCLCEKRNDLLSLENDIQEILKYFNLKNDDFTKFKDKITQKISQLKQTKA